MSFKQTQYIQFVTMVKCPQTGLFRLVVENGTGDEYMHKTALTRPQADRLYDRLLDASFIDEKYWDRIPPHAMHCFSHVA